MLLLKGVRKALVVLAIGSFLLLAFSSCTKRPNEEQRMKMEETRSAALSAEQKLEEVRQQRSEAESKVASKKSQLDKVKSDKADTENRVSNWSDGQ